ncbi:hypothetical protein Aduo_012745 [Ancylostoma duodenale]
MDALDTVKMLVENNTDIFATDFDGRTAVFIGAKFNAIHVLMVGVIGNPHHSSTPTTVARSQEEEAAKKSDNEVPIISEEQFQRLLAALTHSPSATDPAKQFDTLAGRIVQFCYDPEADLTFKAWYRRHADIFTVNAKSLDEATRVRLLLHKLDAASYEKYVNYILPQTLQEVKFDNAISTLKDLFGPQQPLFSTHYTRMKLIKDPKGDLAIYAGRVIRECAKFKLAECNKDQFKCLNFVCGLQSNEDAFIRLMLLDKIESDPNCTI